ncbi:hypothetical protein D3C75_1280250 [compost metagenome]
MPIAEDQLQAIALRVQFDYPHPGIHHRRHPPQTKGPALRTWTLTTQFGVVQPLFAAIGPVQSQLLPTLRITHRQRIHCS